MAELADFTELEAFKLTGVQVTDRLLGHGSYATVQELEYMGLKCAGKKIHELLLEQGDNSYTLRRFEEECRLLSQVRHPNIVQFLGVHFQERIRVPILVMEFLPTNLTSCIDQYGILPKEISYSILHDVGLGLCYLHSQSPPIIHRDLSSNNVLLTSNMTAKISDLGVARILNLTPLQVSRMTQTPGTPAYMPPEVIIANPKYDTSVDEFSYGILMIHVFSGRWPEPQIGPNRMEGDLLIPVTESERREVFLEAIGYDHPLMDLMLSCVSNNPQRRANASEIVEQLTAVLLQSPAPFANRLEMERHIEQLEEDKQRIMEERVTENHQNQQQISSLRGDVQRKAEEVERQNLVCSSKVEELQFQVRDLSTQIELLVAKYEFDIAELKADTGITHKAKKYTDSDEIATQHAIIGRKEAECELMRNALKQKDFVITGVANQLSRAREYLSTKEQVVHAGVSWKQCADLPITLSWASAVVVSGKVYCGGGFTESDDSDYLIFSYDPSQDSWTSLPPLPVKWFGLGQVNGKLVTVGGWDKHVEKRTNKVYTYEQSKKWKQTIPPMPTARNSASVESLTLGLVVAGGCIHNACVNVVEVFKSDTSQWYSASPLPTACCHTSLTSIGDTIYALGGYSHPSHLNQAHFVSFDHLLENAELSTPTPSSHGHSDARTVWKPLPKTSSYEVAATSLVGNLMILGGRESPEGMDSTRQVYIHSSSTDSWIYISDLPASRAGTAVAVLSATEVIVIGGWCYGKVNTVYKGTLHLNV